MNFCLFTKDCHKQEMIQAKDRGQKREQPSKKQKGEPSPSQPNEPT